MFSTNTLTNLCVTTFDWTGRSGTFPTVQYDCLEKGGLLPTAKELRAYKQMNAETHIVKPNGYWLHGSGEVCAYFKQRIFDGKYQYFYWDYSKCGEIRSSVCLIPKENCALNLSNHDIKVRTE